MGGDENRFALLREDADQMLELDSVVEPLVAEAESWSSTQTIPLDSQEMVVKQALLGMARIKLNR